jgi:hypothetical protein
MIRARRVADSTANPEGGRGARGGDADLLGNGVQDGPLLY